MVHERKKKSREERGPRARRRKKGPTKEDTSSTPCSSSSSSVVVVVQQQQQQRQQLQQPEKKFTLRAEAEAFVVEEAKMSLQRRWSKEEQEEEDVECQVWEAFDAEALLLWPARASTPAPTSSEPEELVEEDANLRERVVKWREMAEAARVLSEDEAACRVGAERAGNWASWAVSAAEAERARRIVALAELEEEELRERLRRRAWAARAILAEQRRRVGPDFLLATANTRWFEEMVGARTWNDDYEIVCPYASLGCRHAGPRSTLAHHLCACRYRNSERGSGEDTEANYVVVCPNAVMGCGVVCRRDDLQRHLAACPFSDVSRAVETAQREKWRAVVAAQAEQERDRRVVADARATLASAAARAARRLADAPNPPTPEGMRWRRRGSAFARQAELLRAQRSAALRALGAELREIWRRHEARARALAKPRLAALEAVRAAVVSAFAAIDQHADVSVDLFGSCAYGLETPESDLDLVVRATPSAGGGGVRMPNPTWVLHRLAQQLRRESDGPFQVDRVLDRARVPIVRGRVFVSTGREIKIDLSLATPSHTGLAAAGLCGALVSRLPALAPAAVVVKRLLRDEALNDPYTGGLPSYAVVLMLFYARLHAKRAESQPTRPKARPFERSATLEDSSWRDARLADLLRKPADDPGTRLRRVRPPPPPPESPWVAGRRRGVELLEAGGLETTDADDVDLATALIDFLALFGDDFCPHKEGFSVRHGGRRLVLDSGRRLVISPNLKNGLAHPSCPTIVIEDPLEPRNNVGRSSYNVHRALRLFARRHDRLRAAMSRRDHARSDDNDRAGLGRPLDDPPPRITRVKPTPLAERLLDDPRPNNLDDDDDDDDDVHSDRDLPLLAALFEDNGGDDVHPETPPSRQRRRHDHHHQGDPHPKGR
ncbi:hypothetical protein CTAYLR_001987 [Chrysophaeum taylorii]|uniref:Poly(A) RNA polymerase mitochondrial-like central palm domain-containing protein n=1 Tax=Chrysophaeum taylorii TaxID=2483200 RepID=A0AAD7U8I2_9STRA|nr:hypothetical protein CTAYLR_001987 [Chrysophaeum taylorii]